MDHDVREANPYRELPPTPPSWEVPKARPTGITVIGVVCCLAGVVGILMVLLQVGQLVMGAKFANVLSSSGPTNDPSLILNTRMVELNQRYWIGSVLLAICGIFMGGALLAGGIGALQQKSWALRWLRRVFVALIFYESARMVLFGMVQWSSIPIMQEFAQSMQQGAPSAQQANGAILLIQKITLYVVIIAGVIWFLIKLALISWGIRFLNRPQIVRYFLPEPARSVDSVSFPPK